MAMVWAVDQKTSPKTKQAWGMPIGRAAGDPVIRKDPASRTGESHILASKAMSSARATIVDFSLFCKLAVRVKHPQMRDKCYPNG
jgi:hypothetical protein